VSPHDACRDRWSNLMRAAQVGDKQSYDLLLIEAGRWLRRYYFGRLPESQQEDAVQDALLTIHFRLDNYDGRAPFGAWLAAIARYLWIDRVRKMDREIVSQQEADAPIDDHGPRVCSALVLASAMASLPPGQAIAIRLVKIDGASVREAADATGQSVSLVKVNIHRGLKRIAAMLNTGNEEIPPALEIV